MVSDTGREATTTLTHSWLPARLGLLVHKLSVYSHYSHFHNNEVGVADSSSEPVVHVAEFGSFMGSSSGRSRAVTLVLLLGVFAGAATAVYFWRQNLELRTRLENHRPATQQREAVRRVREGDQLPDFVARSADGQEVHVAKRGSGASLLFIYSPSCERCEAGITGWTRVTQKLKSLKAPVQIVALSIEDSYNTVQHARQVKMPFPAVPFPSVELQRKYGATEVPLTVVLDPQGVVQAVWDKPLDEGEVGDVIETVCPDCPQRAASARSSK